MKIVFFVAIGLLVVLGLLYAQKLTNPKQENAIDAIPSLTNAVFLRREQDCVKSCTTRYCPGGACPDVSALHACVRNECKVDPNNY